MKWIKTMNRDSISPKQEHDMQKQGVQKKIHKCKWWIGGSAGLEELHIVAQLAHCFMESRAGAASISGKRLDVCFLFGGFQLFIYFWPWLSCLHAYVNLAIVVQSKLAGIYITLVQKKRKKCLSWLYHYHTLLYFNFLAERGWKKYYNSKLDDSPTTVSYVIENNLSKSRSIIRYSHFARLWVGVLKCWSLLSFSVIYIKHDIYKLFRIHFCFLTT